MFVMEYKEEQNNNNIIHIRFTREGPRAIDTATENDKLRALFEGVKWSSDSIVDAVDGPQSPEFSRFSKLTYGCTSGSGISIKHHMAKSTFNVVMGGWKKEDLKWALTAELDLDPAVTDEASDKYFDQEKFDAVYFVTGGRIRQFQEFYQGEIDTSFGDEVVARISKQQGALSRSHSDCRSTDAHVDSLRTMFRIPGGSTDSIFLHVDSGYLLRKLWRKTSGEELFHSYKKAETEGNKGAQSNYFEEMLHWCFRQAGMSPSIAQSIHAQGTGSEGVTELTQKNQYWTPSVPNFVNIDSAVVGSDGKVWCYQFTISSSHTYKKRRIKSSFLNHMPLHVKTDEVAIVFVFPEGTHFLAPDTGGEVEVVVSSIDCSTFDAVWASVQRLASNVAP